MINKQRHPASFKDPAGFIFLENGHYLRQVNHGYKENYDFLFHSGLYNELVNKQLLLAHEELPDHPGLDGNAYKVLLPDQLGMMTFPYEWSFTMLKDAALATLQINLKAIDNGMILKDASAFNIFVDKGKAILMDTLSFEKYDEKLPWVAYKQFCQHFLFPLKLMQAGLVDVPRYFLSHLDGIPVAAAAKMLPWQSRFNFGDVLHIHLQNRLVNTNIKKVGVPGFTKAKMVNMLNHLTSIIQKINLSTVRSQWSDYYDISSFDSAYLDDKKSAFLSLVNGLDIINALDIGCNNGYYSMLLADKGVEVIAIDSDMLAIDKLYNKLKEHNTLAVRPLVIDCSNPSPSVGWMNEERASFLDRVSVDLTIALALVHHLFFTYNIPFESILRMLGVLSRQYCIIEFVDISDSKAELISRGKGRLAELFTRKAFEQACKKYFTIKQSIRIGKGERTLYLLKK